MTAVPASEELLDVAREAAQAAAAELLARYERAGGPVGLATKSRRPIRSARPTSRRSARSAPSSPAGARTTGSWGRRGPVDLPGTTGLRWIVDPLDGTVNYLFGVPQWCVSVACEGRHAGVVLDPVRGECFEAAAGAPPTLDGTPVRGRSAATWPRRSWRPASATTPRARRAGRARWPGCCRGCATSAATGSAALDLAWTAFGRFDAFYEHGVHIWDTAAGTLLCELAGLEVRPLPARGALSEGVLVAPSALAGALGELVA